MKRTPGQAAWYEMNQRCSNPKTKCYERYGGRGITVCDRWRESFENFLADMGPRPKGMTLDRIDNDGPYSPENCRWASQKDQQNNRRDNVVLVVGNEARTASEWAEETGIAAQTIRARIHAGWSEEDAVLTPARPLRKQPSSGAAA